MYNKTRTNIEPRPPREQQHNHRLRTDSSLSHRGLKYCILLTSNLAQVILAGLHVLDESGRGGSVVLDSCLFIAFIVYVFV